MIPVVSLLIVVTLSILVTRVASIALTHTGLSMESARFQARSAFTGVGFTTTESEKLVNHPVRRRILLLLMLLGNAGIVSAVSSLLLTGMSMDEGATPALKVVLLVAGIVVLWGVASSQWVDRHLSRLISRALKRYTSLEVTDYASLLNLTGEYRISEIHVGPDDWLANKTLDELAVRDEGVAVLGVKREDGTYLGTPKGETPIVPADTLIVYGRESALGKIGKRRTGPQGEREHREAVNEQESVLVEEAADDTVDTSTAHDNRQFRESESTDSE